MGSTEGSECLYFEEREAMPRFCGSIWRLLGRKWGHLCAIPRGLKRGRTETDGVDG